MKNNPIHGISLIDILYLIDTLKEKYLGLPPVSSVLFPALASFLWYNFLQFDTTNKGHISQLRHPPAEPVWVPVPRNQLAEEWHSLGIALLMLWTGPAPPASHQEHPSRGILGSHHKALSALGHSRQFLVAEVLFPGFPLALEPGCAPGAVSECSGIDTRTGAVQFLSSSLAINTQSLGQDLHQNIHTVPTESWGLSGSHSVLSHPPKKFIFKQSYQPKYLTSHI